MVVTKEIQGSGSIGAGTKKIFCCEKCGEEFEYQDKAFGHETGCGSPLFCRKCGKSLPKSAKFCGECGHASRKTKTTLSKSRADSTPLPYKRVTVSATPRPVQGTDDTISLKEALDALLEEHPDAIITIKDKNDKTPGSLTAPPEDSSSSRFLTTALGIAMLIFLVLLFDSPEETDDESAWGDSDYSSNCCDIDLKVEHRDSEYAELSYSIYFDDSQRGSGTLAYGESEWYRLCTDCSGSHTIEVYWGDGDDCQVDVYLSSSDKTYGCTNR